MVRIFSILVVCAAGVWGQSAGGSQPVASGRLPGSSGNQALSLADNLYQDAMAAFQAQDWKKAEFLLREMRAEAPGDERAGWALVAVLEAQNKVQDALKLGRELVSRDGRSAAGHLRLGGLFMRLNRPEEAMAEFEDALRYSNNPLEQAVAYNQIGAIFLTTDKLDASLGAFRKAKGLGGPPNPMFAMALGEKGNHEEEVAEYRAVLRENPDHSTALNNLAYSFAERGQNLDEALGMALRAVQAEGGNSSYVDTLGWIYYKKGMAAEAEEQMLGALVSEGGIHPTLRQHLAAVMDARGAWTAEKRELRKLLEGELSAGELARLKLLLRKVQTGGGK